MSRRWTILTALTGTLVTALVGAIANAADVAPADLVIVNAKIYTSDVAHPDAQALAVTGDKIRYVGNNREARAYIGSQTKVRDLHGLRVLPGLIDGHIHPIDTFKASHLCDLDSRPVSLAQLTVFVKSCIEREHIPAGQWVSVRQWSYGSGNQADSKHSTLRAALDAASVDHPIHLLGNDGHHGAFNSRALAMARNKAQQVVGLSAKTLGTDFAEFATMVGIGPDGEPDGAVNETLQSAIDGPDEYASDAQDYQEVMQAPWKVTHALNAAGLTGMLDASLVSKRTSFYDALVEQNRLTLRTTIAQFYEPNDFKDLAGKIDFSRMITAAESQRTHFAGQPLIRADVVKLFADGGIDGNPNLSPPTLPNGAMLKPYLQPQFQQDQAGNLVLAGYVDTDSALCQAVRAQPESLPDREQFHKEHGFFPSQCQLSRGALYQSQADLIEFVKQFHQHGFSLHIHVIGDRAVRTAVDAIEQARQSDGVTSTRDGLAHLELPAPEDVRRIGQDHLYVAFTYSWSYIDPSYDISVVPFIDRIEGSNPTAFYRPGHYYYDNAYPTRSVREAGGIDVGGSDAPVTTRDPQPFVNLARAVSRRLPGKPILNPRERLTLREALNSYTIDSARMLGWDTEAGSLQAGKSADFVIIDRDILQLEAQHQMSKIEATRVLETWFCGKKVYARGPHKT